MTVTARARARSTTTIRAADSSVVRLTSEDHDVTGMWDSTIQLMSGRPDGKEPDSAWMREMHIAPRGNADYIISELLDAEVTQTLHAQGGEFLIAESRQEDMQGLALWRGKWHEVSTYLLPAQEGIGANPLAAFDGLLFTDSPQGLVVRAATDEITVTVVDISTNVEGVGDVSVSPAAAALQMVPSWSGARLSAGEVWQVDTTLDEDTEPQLGLFMASASAVITLTPDDPADRRQAAPLRFLESVSRLEWTTDSTSIGAGR